METRIFIGGLKLYSSCKHECDSGAGDDAALAAGTEKLDFPNLRFKLLIFKNESESCCSNKLSRFPITVASRKSKHLQKTRETQLSEVTSSTPLIRKSTDPSLSHPHPHAAGPLLEEEGHR